jgi:hypothetical protein
MINEYIISIESKYNSFNATCGLNKTHSLEEILKCMTPYMIDVVVISDIM